MAEENPNMWEYWRDKKGLEEALTDYYPNLIKTDDVLRNALAQRRIADLAINAHMKSLQTEEDDD